MFSWPSKRSKANSTVDEKKDTIMQVQDDDDDEEDDDRIEAEYIVLSNGD